MSENHQGTGTVQEATDAFIALGQPPEQTTEIEEAPASEEPAEEVLETEEVVEIEESIEIEESEQPETETVEDEEEIQTPIHTVKVNGELIEVTEEELKNSYSRQGDYTRKTLELADERRVLDAGKADIGQMRQRYSDRLIDLEATFNTPAISTEELQRILAEEGAEEFGKAQLKEQVRAKKLNDIKLERQRLAQEQQATQQVDWNNYVQDEGRKLTSIMPKFSDQQAVSKLSEYLVKQGYSAQELSVTADHRSIVIAEKARLWDELQSKKPNIAKKVAKAPKVLKPGARKGKVDPIDKERREALARVKSSGTVHDAAAAFKTIRRNK